MAALIGQDTELALNITRYTGPASQGRDRERYQITRRDDAPGGDHITLTAGQMIGLAALLDDLREREAFR